VGLVPRCVVILNLAKVLTPPAITRRDAQVAICLDLRRAIQSGIPFYRAKNGVILTPGPVGPEFFLRVTDLQTGKEVPRSQGVEQSRGSQPLAPHQSLRNKEFTRSRSPRRLVHHNSLHKGVFWTLPENAEYVSWVIVL
jgi:hypothetical protein